jgi:hypothetical protein
MSFKLLAAPFALFIVLFAFTIQKTSEQKHLDAIAESYVKLVLKVGLYDPYYVDAYHGPEEWKPDEISGEEKQNIPSAVLLERVGNLLDEMKNINTGNFDDLWNRRFRFLEKHLLSVEGRIGILSGKKMTFDEETKILYDVVAPKFDEEYFITAITELDKALPGEGSIYDRYEEIKSACLIPADKLEIIFKTALEECRKRSLQYLSLPDNERFTIEYVSDKPWGAYNWYKGNSYSLIQFNTEIASSVYRALDVTSHEGYPGHHVHNTLIEVNLYRGMNWMEYSVYPLYSPLSLIAEGVAEYGIYLLFSEEERIEYEKNVLFPLAGIDPDGVTEYHRIKKIAAALQSAGVEVARRYLDGTLNKEDAIKWLSDYRLSTPQRAEKTIAFIERYRSYIINYSVGESVIKHYIEKHVGSENNIQKRWELFAEILSLPHVPSDLQDYE